MLRESVHKLDRKRRAARSAAALVGVVGVLLGAVIGAAPAQAAVIGGVITNVTVTPTNPAWGGQIRTNIDFCVPDGTQAGDTFSLTLSEHLTALPTGFPLKDAGGELVATAAIAPGPPAVATFTMTSYAATHINVCGRAFIESSFSSSLTPGVTVPFTSVTNDGATYTTPITPSGQGPTGDMNSSFKFGHLPSTGDQGHTNPNDAVNWNIVTPQGPLTSATITDNPPAGQNIDCTSVSLVIGARTATNVDALAPAPIITPVVCSPDAISVTVGPIPAGQAVRLGFMIDLDVPTGAGSHVFANTANVVSVRADGSIQTDSPASTIATSTGGGSGEGEVPTPSIDIEKYSTAEGVAEGDFDQAPGKAVEIGAPVPVTMTITNRGQEALTDVRVQDATIDGPPMTGLSCVFPDGSTGVTWAGPFAVGSTFHCTGTVPAMSAGGHHSNVATVTAAGVISSVAVEDEDPFHVTPPSFVPAITIIKTDDAGNDANTAADKVELADGSTELRFVIKNTGNETLRSINVSDAVVSNGSVTGLKCLFPDGSSGTEWAGPFSVGDRFECTAVLTGVVAGPDHEDIASVNATGADSGQPVDDKDSYFAVVRNTPPQPAGLAMTGTSTPWQLLGAALIALVAGLSMSLYRRFNAGAKS